MDTRQIAKGIARESIVLLKNEDGLLPFSKEKQVAFFGKAQIGTLYSGNGSGAANVKGAKTILEECEKCRIVPEPELKEYYFQKMQEEEVTEKDEFDWTQIAEKVNSGVMYEIFGKYRAPVPEIEVPEYLIEKTAKKTDTAVLIIGRNSGGEECDRHLTEDYYLTETEKELVNQVCSQFANVVVVLNTNGLIDLAWILDHDSIRSLLFLGIPGEEGAAALAEILAGKISPSGKLPVTIARKYEDYPSAAHFSWNKGKMEEILDYDSYGLSAKENGSDGFAKSPVTVYQEDLYLGYRYFDSFGKNVLFPFGYGLSYTTFQMTQTNMEKTKEGLRIQATVQNTGNRAGREVLQIYVAAGDRNRPIKELKGFEKTRLLSPGEEEQICIELSWRELAIYDEKQAAWVLAEGAHSIVAGFSTQATMAVGILVVEQELVLEQCVNRLGLKKCNHGKILFLKREEDILQKTVIQGQTILSLTAEDVAAMAIIEPVGKRERDHKTANTEIQSELSIEELAALCVGYGPGTPFSAVGDRSDPPTIYDKDGTPLTTNDHPAGFPGYVSPAMEKQGLHSIFYKDGPAGIGELAWPTEMLIACAFDRKLWYDFGNAVGEECEKQKVDVWLAPAVNLHRNPLCGRNFEYFSEDPYLTGVCASEIAKGVKENHPVLVCPKHFAANEQETYRRGNERDNCDAVESILREQTLRELYLKPFEMLVKEAHISCIMTSFNKINGVFAGGNEDLCQHILREEWGFDGVVVTDWGDMDVVVDGAVAVAAGNDIVMPGGPPVIAQILQGYEEGRVSRTALETAAWHLTEVTRRVRRGAEK